jgi:hypothetical protein
LAPLDAGARGHFALAVAGEVFGLRLHAALGIHGVEFQQRERPGHRVMHVLVGKCDVLQHGKELVLALQAAHQLPDRIQAGDRMQRTAVMAGGQVGGTGHRERRSRQQRLDRRAGAKLLQGAIQDFAARGFLNELNQWFYVVRVLDTGVHGELSFVDYRW